jgi:hypothetical protein
MNLPDKCLSSYGEEVTKMYVKFFQILMNALDSGLHYHRHHYPSVSTYQNCESQILIVIRFKKEYY